MLQNLYGWPRISPRFTAVWRRNALVWKKLLGASLLGNLADPLIYLLGLGYGLGGLVGNVNGRPYITFLAAGSLCSATMNSATFESFYSAFSRMHVQRTWDAIMNAPVALEDVVAGELAWAATKACFSGVAILLVAALLGLAAGPVSAWVVLVIPLVGLAFAAPGLVVTACARGYDFFTYYFTLFITPMLFLSGVFFPLEQLPRSMQWAAYCLPLWHATALVRPLMFGEVPPDMALHAGVLLAYTVGCFYVAVVLLRRRLLA
jgi:lipooligosaccharide transport system permease protein